jgi:hypothetical protein
MRRSFFEGKDSVHEISIRIQTFVEIGACHSRYAGNYKNSCFGIQSCRFLHILAKTSKVLNLETIVCILLHVIYLRLMTMERGRNSV